MNTDSFSILYYEYLGKIAVVMRIEDENCISLTKLSDEINIDLGRIRESGEYVDWRVGRYFCGLSSRFSPLCPVLITTQVIY